MTHQPGTPTKRPKPDGSTNPGGTDRGGGEPTSEGGQKEEDTKKSLKQPPEVQSAIYGAHMISSSFDITHTIHIILIGMWVSLK